MNNTNKCGRYQAKTTPAKGTKTFTSKTCDRCAFFEKAFLSLPRRCSHGNGHVLKDLVACKEYVRSPGPDVDRFKRGAKAFRGEVGASAASKRCSGCFNWERSTADPEKGFCSTRRSFTPQNLFCSDYKKETLTSAAIKCF
jgi:hypothetical protein